ncbi:hypothetical protein ACFRQM_19760 [Streptomyces sp. NPDC056831]|uniref:hypothetical protein n=1 Tax=Streptomyces sp. NPDC056831 TaxID=3345954 RepID=UPI00367C7228
MFGTDRRAVVPVGFVALLPAALVPLTAERADAAPTADNCPQGMVCFYSAGRLPGIRADR